MQFIALLLIMCMSIHAKSDFCSFSAEFSEKYLEARKNYANNIKERRKKSDSKVSSGNFRTREHKQNWDSVSMKSFINKLFHTSDIEIKVKGNGKMLIYPKRIRDGEPVIVFDPSGDYFRIAKGSISKSGVIRDENLYFDIQGKVVQLPQTKTDEAMDAFARKTHFQAKP